MADIVKKVAYCYLTVPNRSGTGAKVLGALADAGVNLLCFSGFPAKGGKAQLDLVTDDLPRVRRVAKRNGWKMSAAKDAFLVQGADRAGAVHHHITRLAKAGIGVTAADAVSAGAGRWGMILWVKRKDVGRAAKALGAK
jgi:hypothetical protein